MSKPGGTQTLRNSADLRREIAGLHRKLPVLRAQLREAEARERVARRLQVETAYCAGEDRAKICRDFRLTAGQLAGWAFRGRWSRPADKVADLTPGQRALYADLREDRPKAAAVRLAREAYA